MPDQTVLWRQEGSAWLERNRAALTYEGTHLADPILTLLGLYPLTPTCLLDIGCSTGWRAAYLAKHYQCRAIGVDISAEAIAEGRELYPEVALLEGTATALPVPSGSVDLCLCVFLLHCLSRETLLLAASEIDRVLAWGAYLLLADFDPDRPMQRPWHHRAGLWTFKLPRAGAGIFESTGLYRQVAYLSYDHDGHQLGGAVSDDRRGAIVLLRKENTYQACE